MFLGQKWAKFENNATLNALNLIECRCSIGEDTVPEVQLNMFCWIVHCLIYKLAKFKSLLPNISLGFLVVPVIKHFLKPYNFKDIAVLQASSENKCATIKAFETGPQYHYVLVIPSKCLCIGGKCPPADLEEVSKKFIQYFPL